MSCCQPAQPTKAEFLESKLKNFRAWLQPKVKKEHQSLLDAYRSLEDAMPVLQQVVVACKAGQRETVIQAIVEKCEGLTADDIKKLGLYLDMFYSILTE